MLKHLNAVSFVLKIKMSTVSIFFIYNIYDTIPPCGIAVRRPVYLTYAMTLRMLTYSFTFQLFLWSFFSIHSLIWESSKYNFVARFLSITAKIRLLTYVLFSVLSTMGLWALYLDMKSLMASIILVRFTKSK